MAWEARLGLKHNQPYTGPVKNAGLNGLGSPSGGRKFSQDWHSWLYESALVFVDVRFVASEEASEYVARREDGD